MDYNKKYLIVIQSKILSMFNYSQRFAVAAMSLKVTLGCH